MTAAVIRRASAVMVPTVLLASLVLATTAARVSAKPTCDWRPATIVGTAKGEVIRGTPGRDIIDARGGHDIVYGLGGNDVICGGPGNDTIYGGPGRDILRGGTGRDVINGGAGDDWLKGDADADRIIGARGWDNLLGGTGPDVLYGGPGSDVLAGFDGDDRLYGGAGHDHLMGGLGADRCVQGQATGPHLGCEVVAKVKPRNLAIAWSDLDGNHRYGPGDVLISRLFDTNGDGIPSAGDTIFMGRYPLDMRMRGFADWGVDEHEVVGLADYSGIDDEGPWPQGLQYNLYTIRVQTANGEHLWTELFAGGYGENTLPASNTGRGSGFSEGHVGWDPTDHIVVMHGSPSQPEIEVDRNARRSPVDKGYIDVDVYP